MSLSRPVSVLSHASHPLPRRTFLRGLGAALLLAGAARVSAQSARERLIVSGASGQLGTLVVEELLARGADPRDLILVSRTPEELAPYAARGAATRFGDFTQPESLPAAYEGGSRMLLISISAGPDNRPQLHKNAIDAARAVGVRHIVYTSTVDADNIVGQAQRMVAEGRVVAQPDEIPTAYVTREDCAAAAAAVLLTPGHEGKVYDITGPRAVLRSDIARIASEVTGRPVEIVRGLGGEPQASGAIAGFASFDVTSDAVETLTGRPATSIEALLERNRETLLQPAAVPQ